MGRAPCCDKANVKKGPWSPEEDAKLKAYIEQYGTGGNWIALPQKIGLKRCGKSCRLRWLNYLRPNIKHGGFSEEEDNVICRLYISIGSRWSIIAAQLPGRTDNDIKNYWNTKLKKKLLGRRKHSNTISRLSSSTSPDSVEGHISSPPSSSQALSNSALERLQLHMQLQRLQDPLSLDSNAALWPKLHPFQEKVILQAINERSSPLMQSLLQSPHQQQAAGNDVHHRNRVDDVYEQLVNSVVLQQKSEVDPVENSLNAIASSDGPVSFASDYNMMDSNVGDHQQSNGATIQPPVSAFQSELEDFLNNNKTPSSSFNVTQEEQFDCFKGMNDGSKDSLVWWPNDFETKSASSNSWDSTCVLQSEPMMFQDYEFGLPHVKTS